MKIKSMVLLVAALGFSLLGASHNAMGQRLHDEERDKKAQEAAALAKEIRNNSTFEHQLKNLDAFSRRSAEVYFRGAEQQMNLDIDNFKTWGRVASSVARVRKTLEKEDFISKATADAINSDLEKKCPRTTDLGKAICSAQEELARSKKAMAVNEKGGKDLEKELENRLETIGEIESLANKAESFLKADSTNNKIIKGFTEVFVNLSQAFVNFTNKLSVIGNEPRDEVKFLLERTALEALQVEVDHWKAVGEIQLRRVQEQEDLVALANEFDNGLQKIAVLYPCVDSEYRGRSFKDRAAMLNDEGPDVILSKIKALPPKTKCLIDNKERNKNALAAFVLKTLHLASALAARGNTPMKLADLRLAQEMHRVSIRQSAVIARGYELVLASGTDRLSRYYAGGLKPDKIAQLIHAAATVAIPAVIAGN